MTEFVWGPGKMQSAHGVEMTARLVFGKWREDIIGGPISDDGTYMGRLLAWNYRSNVTRFALHDFGEEVAQVEFDWPGTLLTVDVPEFVDFGGRVVTTKGDQLVRVGGRDHRLRFARA